MAEPAKRRVPTPGPRLARPPRRLTGRAALLAVVLCAIALSLAYPVREYIAQRRQIDQLIAQRQSVSAQVKSLNAEQQRLSDPAYVKQQAMDQLHMCMPAEKCYVVVNGSQGPGGQQAASAGTPWYAKLWRSLTQADQGPGR